MLGRRSPGGGRGRRGTENSGKMFRSDIVLFAIVSPLSLCLRETELCGAGEKKIPAKQFDDDCCFGAYRCITQIRASTCWSFPYQGGGALQRGGEKFTVFVAICFCRCSSSPGLGGGAPTRIFFCMILFSCFLYGGGALREAGYRKIPGNCFDGGFSGLGAHCCTTV